MDVHRLKRHYFGIPIIDRKYENTDYEDVSPLPDVTISFNNEELKNKNFVYNYLKFEELDAFKYFMKHQQAGFTIYKGTVNERM